MSDTRLPKDMPTRKQMEAFIDARSYRINAELSPADNTQSSQSPQMIEILNNNLPDRSLTKAEYDEFFDVALAFEAEIDRLNAVIGGES